MNEPYLALHVSRNMLCFTKKVPSEEKPRDILEVDIEEVTADDFDTAAKKLGVTALGILSLWYQSHFKGWGSFAPADEKDKVNEFAMTLRLIDRFTPGCSEDRLKLIDELLAEASVDDVEAEKYLHNDWPFLRQAIQEKNA
jgi:hypothetical protein